MAVDKNKIVAEATRLAQKGQYDKAIKAYEKILAEDRKEVRTLLKVGELQQKKGDNPSAAATFNQVAEIYGEQGFFLKAVAVYKQIAKLTPDDVRVNEKLAGLYQQLGLLNDATTQLQAVATAHEKAGDQGRHLDVLRKLLDLDPENVVTCQRLGNLYAKANRTAEALELYRRAAAHLRENKRGDEYVKLAERIYQLTPDDLKLARELAQEYLARGDTKKALGKLQACHGADKQDVETLRLMAQAFRDLGQVSKTIAVYRALARVYAERGRREEAAVTWRQVLDLLPDDPEATEELAAVAASPAAPSRPAPPRPVMTPPPAAAPARPVTAPGPRAAPPVATPRVAPAAVPGSPASRILTEADVYLKYGLHQKALDHLQKILDSDPESPDALERIRDIRETLGDRTGAAEAAERVVRALLERGDEARIAAATERLRQLDPSHAEVIVDLSPAPGEELPLPDDEPAPVAPGPEELPLPEEPPAPEAAVELSGEAPTPPEPFEPVVDEGPVEFAPPGADAPVLVPPDDDRPKPVGGEEGPAPVQDDESPAAMAAYAGIPIDDEAPPMPEAGRGVEVVVAPEPMTLGDDSPLPIDDPMMEIEVSEPEREPTVAEPLAPAPEPAPEPAVEAVDEAAADALSLDDVEVEEIEADAVVEEPRPPGPPPLAAPPFAAAPPPLPEPLPEPVAEQLPEPVAEPAPEPSLELAPAPDLVPEPVPEPTWPALDAELEEVEFYERQGLLEEALLAIRDLAAVHPGHPAVEPVLARLESLASLEEGAAATPVSAEEDEGATAEPPPAPAAGSPPPEPGEYAATGTTGIFDLGAELSAELGPELAPTPTGEFQYSVADVFDQFKRGLEKTVRPDDSATKYDLGIAFQEMGMLDEALEQFRSALAGGDRKREVDILNMIGTCLGMKGLHAEAIEAYRQALRSEFLSGEAAKAVHYELGAAHEALGEPEVALWYFQKVAHVSPGYRGVGERVAGLGGGPGIPPGSVPAGPATPVAPAEKPPPGKRSRKR